jgi:hypothetical protein
VEWDEDLEEEQFKTAKKYILMQEIKMNEKDQPQEMKDKWCQILHNVLLEINIGMACSSQNTENECELITILHQVREVNLIIRDFL